MKRMDRVCSRVHEHHVGTVLRTNPDGTVMVSWNHNGVTGRHQPSALRLLDRKE